MTNVKNWAEFLFLAAQKHAHKTALMKGDIELGYAAWASSVKRCAAGLRAAGLNKGDRIAVYLPKTIETATVFCAAAQAGLIVVPINPALKNEQVRHILNDCDVRCLVSQSARLSVLGNVLEEISSLDLVYSIDGDGVSAFESLFGEDADTTVSGGGSDLAFILYTSGSTGKPKGVMVSHDNIISGAVVVSGYLKLDESDRILALLPFSFDYGLNQLMMSLYVGATLILHDYFLPGDAVKLIGRKGVTKLACVPPLWHQLMDVSWPEEAVSSLKTLTNTGGRMPRVLLDMLRRTFPKASIYLMYGLTEAFRSTYLDPQELDNRPESIGKPVPGENVLVLKADGSLCADDEVGELVHIGRFVAQGYWGDEERTKKRFRPAPKVCENAHPGQCAVWSGDKVRRDKDGFLYFVGRDDEMMKTSGYRVSPTEVEEALMSLPQVAQAVVFGRMDQALGEAIIAVITLRQGEGFDEKVILRSLRANLPIYMIPKTLICRANLPINPNGKVDRTKVRDTAMRELRDG